VAVVVFKIGEFSKLVRVSARMLRHYDKNGLFIPAEVDPFTGYRLYSAKQIPLLMKIISLRDAGFSVDEMEEVLSRFDDPAYMADALAKKRRQVLSQLEAERTKLDHITSMTEKIKKEMDQMTYVVELKEIPAIGVLSLREVISSFKEEFGQWDKLVTFINTHGIECEMRGHSIYHDGEHKESEVDVEIAFPVKEMGKDQDGFVFKELEGIPLAATIRFPLPYTNYNKAMEKLAVWLEEERYEIVGLIRGVAIDEDTVELQIPVNKK